MTLQVSMKPHTPLIEINGKAQQRLKIGRGMLYGITIYPARLKVGRVWIRDGNGSKITVFERTTLASLAGGATAGPLFRDTGGIAVPVMLSSHTKTGWEVQVGKGMSVRVGYALEDA